MPCILAHHYKPSFPNGSLPSNAFFIIQIQTFIVHSSEASLTYASMQLNYLGRFSEHAPVCLV